MDRHRASAVFYSHSFGADDKNIVYGQSIKPTPMLRSLDGLLRADDGRLILLRLHMAKLNSPPPFGDSVATDPSAGEKGLTNSAAIGQPSARPPAG
jgi:hypothetical protein